MATLLCNSSTSIREEIHAIKPLPVRMRAHDSFFKLVKARLETFLLADFSPAVPWRSSHALILDNPLGGDLPPNPPAQASSSSSSSPT